jgi:cytosol alanyl aminopeptidase
VVAPRPPVEKPLVLAPLPAEVPDRLPHTFEPTSYAARLAVDPEHTTFTGTIEITGELAEPSALIWINAEYLSITHVDASRDGVRVAMVATYLTARRGWLALRSEQPLAQGAWTLSIDYYGTWNERDAWGGFRQTKTGNARDRDGEHYVFTQFEPDYARTIFPCFDEPDRKVPWQLTLEVPDALVAASNTPIESETRQPAVSTPGTKQSPIKTVRFAKTQPLPSYLIAFAVGPFDVVEAGKSKSGIPMRILTARGDSRLAAYATTSAPLLLDKIEAWLGVPFPYPKLDFVAVPRTADWWAAMENAGLITFTARALNHDASFDGFAAHELAHQWFGDLVTLAWWSDIWLNESFAYWIGNKFAAEHPWDPRTGHVPIVDDDHRNPRTQMGDFSAVHKGGQLLAVLERALGGERFARLLQRYLTTHAHGTVRTSDLRAAVAQVADEHFAALIDRYATYPTEPLTLELDCTTKIKRVDVKGFGTTGLVCIAYDRDGTRDERCATLTWGSARVELPAKRCPRWLLPRSPHDIQFSSVQLEAIRDAGWQSLDNDERRSITSYVLAQDPTRGRLRLSYIAKAAPSADDWLLSSMTSYLVSIDRRVPPGQRPRYDAWIATLFGERARTFGIDREPDPQTRASMYPLLSVVLGARDPGLVRDALALLPNLDKLEAPTRVLVLRASIIDKPSVAEDLIAELPKAPAHRIADIAFALESAPNLLDLMRKHVEPLKRLQIYQLRRLFDQLCDESRRADVEQLGRDLFPKPDPGMLRDYEWCIQERKRLEPELRAFFAGTAAAKSTKVRR